MADATAAPTPAPEATPTAAAAIAAPSTDKPRGQALVRKHVEQHEKALAEEAKAELEATPEPGEKQRDPKTGQFLKPGKVKTPPAAKPATAAAQKPVTAAVDPATPEPEAPGPSADSKARRLVKEGKLAEACQTIGLDPSKLTSPQWKAWRKNNEEAAKTILESRSAVERDRQQIQAEARQLVNDLGPFIRGKQAYDKGDFEEAFHLWTGEDLNSFQRKALASMHQPGLAKDPVVAELRKEIAAMRAERQQEREQMTQAQQQASVRQQQAALWDQNVRELADSGNPRMTELSQDRDFMAMVWQIRGKHWDAATQSTLPALEAAELALEQLEAQHQKLSKVFGGASAPSDANATRTRAVTPAATGQGGTPARRSTRTTSLNPAEAAEAAPATKLRGKELIDLHARRAIADHLRSNGV